MQVWVVGLVCLIAGCAAQPPKYKGYRLEIHERPAVMRPGENRLGVVAGH